MLAFLRKRRRRKLLERPIPAGWEKILDRNVPHTSLLNEGEREELLRHTRILVAEKRFEGCGGLRITEEMQVTIAGWGALLLLNREAEYYPSLETILVYPSSFVVPVRQGLAEGSVAQVTAEEVHIGESLGEGGPGTILLAWDEVLRCAEDESDGVNVCLHEFAHRLDEEDGELNGSPLIEDSELRGRWTTVFEKEFAQLKQDTERYERESGASGELEPLLDPYALTSSAEFFAVAVETFFEWPLDLENEHPALYGVIRDFFRQDPAARWRS